MGQFESYAKLAKSNKSTTEIVGRYKGQENAEKYIFSDLSDKLVNMKRENITICDIGCGCGILIENIINYSKQNHNTLTLIDSKEMLNRIKDESFINKIEGKFPANLLEINSKFDVIIVYSVLQCIFLDGNTFDFLDSCVELLDDGGELLIGDIPNFSKKKRFLKTKFGLELHNKTSNTSIDNILEDGFNKMALDDSFILMILNRYRNMGFEVYLLPQKENLPFSYTREDILIKKSIL